MRRRTKGQSLVEMALLLPLMLVVLFGIIDFGWYVYNYATIYMATRDGAEKGSQLPPMPNKLGNMNRTSSTVDVCVYNILSEIQQNAVLIPNLTSNTPSYVSISYPVKRALGEQIEVRTSYTVQPLTPLWNLVRFGNQGRITVSVATRRTIETLGNNPNSPNLVACN